MSQKETKYHKTLASYFQSKPLYLDESTWKKPNNRKLVELPWQQTRGEMWDEVTDTLCNLDLIQAKATAKMTFDMVADFNAVLELIPENADNIREEKNKQARMDKYTRNLIACAKGEITIEELEIPESITPWTKEQTDAEIERIRTNPTKADRLKDFLSFLGQEANNLQNYAYEFSHFATQQAWNYSNDGPVGKRAEKCSDEIYKFLVLRSKNTRPQWNPLPQLFKVLKGHRFIVTAISITADGKKAISGSRDETCIVWDLTSGEALHTLKGHSDIVTSVSITPDGKLAISGSWDNTCILWDLKSGKPIHTLNGHNSKVNSVAITPDGQLGISGSGNTCILWNLNTGESLKTLIGHTNAISALSITSDGKRAISCSYDKTCIFWDLTTGKILQTLIGHNDSVVTVSITPDGKRAISGSNDQTCIVWDLTTGKVIQTLIGQTGSVVSVSITPDGKRAICGYIGQKCMIWELNTGQILKIMNGHLHNFKSLNISPDGERAISVSRNSCFLWNINKVQGEQILKEPAINVFSVAITLDRKRSFLGCWEGSCIWFDVYNKHVIKTLQGHNNAVNCVSITHDGERAISGSGDKTCILWDLKSGEAIHTLKGHTDWVRAVAITYDGQRAITGSEDKTCILWDLKSGESIQTFKGHSGWVISLAITPDGQMIFSGSYDNTCILWDLSTGEVLQSLKGHTSGVTAVAITPNGKLAISGSLDNSCILWDLTAGEALHSFTGHTSGVTAVSITPDGKRAITSSKDNSCILWDLEHRKLLSRFTSFSNVLAFSFFSNGFSLYGDNAEVISLYLNRQILFSGISISTICEVWNYEMEKLKERSADCPLCGHRFAPPASVLDTIEKITKKAGLKPEQSPCLELPDEVWEEPGLLGNCPKCREKLKFNPFIAGGG